MFTHPQLVRSPDDSKPVYAVARVDQYPQMLLKSLRVVSCNFLQFSDIDINPQWLVLDGMCSLRSPSMERNQVVGTSGWIQADLNGSKCWYPTGTSGAWDGILMQYGVVKRCLGHRYLVDRQLCYKNIIIIIFNRSSGVPPSCSIYCRLILVAQKLMSCRIQIYI